MKLLTKEITQKLLANFPAGSDTKPAVKFFTPDGAATWLLADLDPADNDSLFGLCDLGMGFPELGYVSFRDISQLRGKFGLPVERDTGFRANKTLTEYADAASAKGHI